MKSVPPDKIAVNTLNRDIEKFNSLSDEMIKVGKIANDQPDMSFNIPSEFQELNLDDFLVEKLHDIPEVNREKYALRVQSELNEIRNRNMENLIRALIYIVHKFKTTDTVWGIGRGSSCASLVLYLIGVHLVDPIKYNIPMSEFFHS